MIAHRRLANSLGFILRHFRWAPYLLSGAQKVQVQRVELSSSLLRMFIFVFDPLTQVHITSMNWTEARMSIRHSEVHSLSPVMFMK
jgi:hypothetical protein